ncbi:hypothetical protein ACMYSQ_009102 [Aspergillus niger]
MEDTTHGYDAIIPLQLSGPQTPLWLVHSASGNFLICANIAPCPRLPSGLSPLARKCGSWARWDGPPDIADLVSRLTWNEGLMMVGYFYELIDEPRCVALMSDLIAMTTWKRPYDDDYKEEE